MLSLTLVVTRVSGFSAVKPRSAAAGVGKRTLRRLGTKSLTFKRAMIEPRNAKLLTGGRANQQELDLGNLKT